MAQALYRGLGAGRTGRTKYCGRFSKKINVTQFLVNRTTGLLNESLGAAFFLDQVVGAPTGSMAATESVTDTFAATGEAPPYGVLAATEAGIDTFAATGTVATPAVTGTLAATETGSDTFASSGTVTTPGIAAGGFDIPVLARRRGRR